MDFIVLQVNLLKYKFVSMSMTITGCLWICRQNYKQHQFNIMDVFVILIQVFHITSPKLIVFQPMATPYYDHIDSKVLKNWILQAGITMIQSLNISYIASKRNNVCMTAFSQFLFCLTGRETVMPFTNGYNLESHEFFFIVISYRV